MYDVPLNLPWTSPPVKMWDRGLLHSVYPGKSFFFNQAVNEIDIHPKVEKWVRVVIPTGRYSDRSIFRQTGRYSDRSLFQQVDIPTGRYSDRSIFRQTARYSDRSLFRQVDSPTNRSLFRHLDSSTNRSIFRKVYIPTGRYSDIKIIVMRGLTTINSYCGDE